MAFPWLRISGFTSSTEVPPGRENCGQNQLSQLHLSTGGSSGDRPTTRNRPRTPPSQRPPLSAGGLALLDAVALPAPPRPPVTPPAARRVAIKPSPADTSPPQLPEESPRSAGSSRGWGSAAGPGGFSAHTSLPAGGRAEGALLRRGPRRHEPANTMRRAHGRVGIRLPGGRGRRGGGGRSDVCADADGSRRR